MGILFSFTKCQLRKQIIFFGDNLCQLQCSCEKVNLQGISFRCMPWDSMIFLQGYLSDDYNNFDYFESALLAIFVTRFKNRQWRLSKYLTNVYFSYLLHIYLDLKSPKFCCNTNKSLLHRHLNELELRT